MVLIIISLILLGFGLMFYAMHAWMNDIHIKKKATTPVAIGIGIVGFAFLVTGIFLGDARKAEYREQIEQCMLMQIQQEGLDAETAEFVCEEEMK